MKKEKIGIKNLKSKSTMKTKLNGIKQNSILRKLKLLWKVIKKIKKRKSDASIHFSGRERHVLREQYAQSKEKMGKKKTCNDSLHFLGREWEYDPLNKGERNETGVEGKKEAEAGRNNKNPQLQSKNPNSKSPNRKPKIQTRNPKNFPQMILTKMKRKSHFKNARNIRSQTQNLQKKRRRKTYLIPNPKLQKVKLPNRNEISAFKCPNQVSKPAEDEDNWRCKKQTKAIPKEAEDEDNWRCEKQTKAIPKPAEDEDNWRCKKQTKAIPKPGR